MADGSSRLQQKSMRPSDAPAVKRIRTRETILRANVCNLIICAVEAVRYPGTAPGHIYHELVRRVACPHLGIFVGWEGRVPRALCVAVLPDSVLMMAPQVCLVYNDGAPALLRSLSQRVRAWMSEAGYKTALGINLWRDDRVFERGFRHFGKPARKGSLIEFDLT